MENGTAFRCTLIHPRKLSIDTPPKTNMDPPKKVVSKRNLLFQGAPIFSCHVGFGGCKMLVLPVRDP